MRERTTDNATQGGWMEVQTKRGSTLLLCLLLALAACAIASAGATAALPSYAECEATEGPFSDPGCHHLGPPDTWAVVPFEFGPETLVKATFEARVAKAGLRIEPTTGMALTCKGASSSGEFAGSKEERAVLYAFRGCRLGSQPCMSAGQQAGRITTYPLTAVLGYLAGAGTSMPTVGLSFSAESEPYLLQASCGSVNVRLSGAVVGVVSHDIDFMSKVSIQTFAQTAGVQEFTSFEGGTPSERQLQLEFSGGSYGVGTPALAAGLQLAERVPWPMFMEIEA